MMPRELPTELDNNQSKAGARTSSDIEAVDQAAKRTRSESISDAVIVDYLPVGIFDNQLVATVNQNLTTFKQQLLSASDEIVRQRIWVENDYYRHIFCGGKYGNNQEFGLLPATVLDNLMFMYNNLPAEYAHTLVTNPNFSKVINEDGANYVSLFCAANVKQTMRSLLSIKDEVLIKKISLASNGQYELALLPYQQAKAKNAARYKANQEALIEARAKDKAKKEAAKIRNQARTLARKEARAKAKAEAENQSVIAAEETDEFTPAASMYSSATLFTPASSLYTDFAPLVDTDAPSYTDFAPEIDIDAVLTEHKLFGHK